MPAITYAKARNDTKTAAKKISFSLLITMLIGLPCTIGMIIYAQPILNLLFPNATEGALILQISSISIIFTMLEQTVNGALQGLGKIMVPAASLLIGVLAKLILNLILVPMEGIGAVGAAFATVVCHVIAFFISFNVLKKNMNLNLGYNKFIIKPMLACLCMSICSYATYIFLISICIEKLATIIAIIFAILIYILSIIGLKIFTEEEILEAPFGEKLYKILKLLKIYD